MKVIEASLPAAAGFAYIGLMPTPSSRRPKPVVLCILDGWGFRADPAPDNAIAQALVRAHQRGVKVQVLLDEKSESTNRYVISLFRSTGVPMRADGSHAIAHNKVMVIDQQVLVTGSFNFTNSAETRNAENLLILSGVSLAQAYRENWLSHWSHARP
mgnify:CR=1 FL=1